jgi:hypothetical protein
MATLRAAILLLVACSITSKAGAVEDIEFVAEHLAEVPMDNRFATLPVWGPAGDATGSWSFVGQLGYATTTAGNLEVAGPMFSAAASRTLDERWSLGAFAFFDTLSLSGNHDERPLQTLFAPEAPFARPVMARFDDLDGSLWQRVELLDYRLNYQLLEGEAVDASGQIDFDANYDHVTPFFGLELPRVGKRWAITPHMLAAWPIPKHGIVGHITGPGFDLRGDTEEAGAGVHFGDPSFTIGLDVTYLPAHFSVDIGTLVTQRLFEPIINKGIETNWVLSCQWRF